MPDAKQLKEILDTVSTEIPKLLESISKVLLNPENATSMGKSVAQFYKELVAAGMAPEKAYQLTRDFMANFSLGGMISSAISGGEAFKNKKQED